MAKTERFICGNVDSCPANEAHDFPLIGETVTLASDGYLRIVGGTDTEEEAWYLAEGGSTATVTIIDPEIHCVAIQFGEGGPEMWADIDDDIRY